MDKRTRNKIIKYLDELIIFREDGGENAKDIENFITKLEKMEVSDSSMTSPGKARRPKPATKSAKSPRKTRKTKEVDVDDDMEEDD